MVSGVLYSLIWWSREGHKLKGRSSPLSWLQDTLQRLSKPARRQQQQLKKQQQQQQQQPRNLAATAAEKRLQVRNGS
jgi:hypothetical protein